MATINAQNLIQRQFFSPTADTRSPLIQALTGAITQGRSDAAVRDRNQLFATGAEAAFQGTLSPQQAAQLSTADPERAAAVMKSAGAFTESGRQKLAQTAFRIQGMQDPNQQTAAIENVIQQIQGSGGDPSVWVNMLQGNPQQRNQELAGIQQAVLSVKERGEAGLAQDKLALDTRNVDSQISARGVTAAQKAAQLGFDRETLEVRKLENQQTVINNQIKQETNAIKRDQLIQTFNKNEAAIKQAKLDQQFNAESAIDAISDTILTTKALLKDDGLEKAAGVSSAFFTVPGTDAANFEATLDTFKSQQFTLLVEKMRGLGALGEKEGEKLIASAGSLRLGMSDKFLRSEITRIQARLKKAKERIERKFAVPTERKQTGDEDTGGTITNSIGTSSTSNNRTSSLSSRVKAATTPKARDVILQSLTDDDVLNMSTEDFKILLGQ